MRRLRGRLGLRGFDGIDSNGLSGGLALYWDEALRLEVIEVKERLIDAVVRSSDRAQQWRLTCIYGELRVENRHIMWSQLCNMSTNFDIPWLVVGDFNECMWSFEHFSSTPRAEP
jgi:hypothetical protein